MSNLQWHSPGDSSLRDLLDPAPESIYTCLAGEDRGLGGTESDADARCMLWTARNPQDRANSRDKQHVERTDGRPSQRKGGATGGCACRAWLPLIGGHSTRRW